MSARCGADWPPRVAILAGGRATRLLPLTSAMPKSLVPVCGGPFLAHQLRLLQEGGIREVVICCGHLGEQIEEFAGDGGRFGLSIVYSYDGEQALGTGGALRMALPHLGRRFLAMYGDSWLTEPLGAVWSAYLRCGKAGLMTVFRNENRWGVSNVEYRNGMVVCYDKAQRNAGMRHIDYGLNALDADVLAEWPEEVFDLAEVWAALARRGELAGYETAGRFFEIGSPGGLCETEAAIAARMRCGVGMNPSRQSGVQEVCG